MGIETMSDNPTKGRSVRNNNSDHADRDQSRGGEKPDLHLALLDGGIGKPGSRVEPPSEGASGKPADATLKAVDKSANINIKDGEHKAVDAYVKPNEYGNMILRKNGSKVIPTSDGFDEISNDGKAKRSWKREGNSNDYSWTDPSGKKHTFKNVDINRNSNMSYVNESGQTIVIRGNGTIIPTGPNRPQFSFDDQGRIPSIVPTQEAWNKGAPSQSYTFVDNTEQLRTITEIDKNHPNTPLTHTRVFDRKKNAYLNEFDLQYIGQDRQIHTMRWKGDMTLTDNGSLTYPKTLKINGKDETVTYLQHPGGSPDTDEHIAERKQADGSTSLINFSTTDGKTAGSPLYIQTQTKEGQLLRRYDITADGKQITVSDPNSKNVDRWTKAADDKWHGERLVDNGQQTGKDLGVRNKLGCDSSGTLEYLDEKGSKHTENKYGQEENQKVVDKNSYIVTDGDGRTIKAGMVTNYGPDHKNYLTYNYSDKKTADGKPIVTSVNAVVNGKSKEVWSSADGEADENPSGNGEFKYTAKDGKKVTIKPDLTVHESMLAKDGQPERKTKITYLENDSERIFGEGGSPDQPDKITDIYMDHEGNKIFRTFEALSVDKEEQNNEDESKKDKPKDQEKEDPEKKEYKDYLQNIKMWEMKVAKISKKDLEAAKANNGKLPEPKPVESDNESAPIFGIEVMDTGDFEFTPSSVGQDSNYRFLAVGRAMAERMVPVPPPDRMLRAINNFNQIYKRDELPEETSKSSKRVTIVDGKVVHTKSTGKDPNLLTTKALEHITRISEKLRLSKIDLPTNISGIPPAELMKKYSDVAYRYELFAAMHAVKRARAQGVK